jgi:5-methylthioadenosine/S-adenosylhomocysteine deaminase
MMRMLTIDGARVLGAEHLIGSIEPGKRADLVVLDAGRLDMTPGYDAVSNVIYAAGSRAVRDVMVDGRWLVSGNRLVEADERALAVEHNAVALQYRRPS